jgi:hypothetical protein
MARKLGNFLIIIGLVFLLYLGVLAYPQPFFHYHTQVGNIIIYLDEPPSEQVYQMLNRVKEKIDASGLNDPNIQNRVFLVRDIPKYTLFTNIFYRTGGINYSYLNGNSFIRPANVANQRLIGPSGKEILGDRTLDYFIAHEITHGLTINWIGRVRYWNMPIWVREGYADYVGKGSKDFNQLLTEFKEGDVKMDPARSGLYSRYHLLVLYLLDIKKVSLEDLFYGSHDVEKLEQELKEYPDRLSNK